MERAVRADMTEIGSSTRIEHLQQQVKRLEGELNALRHSQALQHQSSLREIDDSTMRTGHESQLDGALQDFLNVTLHPITSALHQVIRTEQQARDALQAHLDTRADIRHKAIQTSPSLLEHLYDKVRQEVAPPSQDPLPVAITPGMGSAQGASSPKASRIEETDEPERFFDDSDVHPFVDEFVAHADIDVDSMAAAHDHGAAHEAGTDQDVYAVLSDDDSQHHSSPSISPSPLIVDVGRATAGTTASLGTGSTRDPYSFATQLSGDVALLHETETETEDDDDFRPATARLLQKEPIILTPQRRRTASYAAHTRSREERASPSPTRALARTGGDTSTVTLPHYSPTTEYMVSSSPMSVLEQRRMEPMVPSDDADIMQAGSASEHRAPLAPLGDDDTNVPHGMASSDAHSSHRAGRHMRRKDERRDAMAEHENQASSSSTHEAVTRPLYPFAPPPSNLRNDH